ncbi:broad-complex core protein isoform X1 [Drosophila subobscura]|uniref:broad-complex core protein isoform X1 n=1 Tax=Drosophila subobscura TaxID=7241 RepID=UPI00155A6462|nr:broad-complex core protein isoform X1 [Drosophila subobscura]
MDDEFKLCWKNFQENIASGFQNLYDRGDLVDVTLACDGKLLQAHKIVLAICSPYFQEIFTSNPCRHPIIILKDVSFNIMLELLEFMYQGVVNVKHTELQSFMKIGQLLQIKGLATNSNSSPTSSASEKSASQAPNHGQGDESTLGNSHNNSHSSNHHNTSNSTNNTANNNSSSNNITNNSSSSSNSNSKPDADQSEAKGLSTQSNSRTTSPGGASRASSDASHMYALNKRPAPSDFSNDSLSIYSGKQLRRSMKEHTGVGQHEGGSDHADNGASLESPLNTEEFFLPPIPHLSLGEPRYDLGGLKREQDGHHGPGGGGSAGSLSSSASSSTPVNSLRNPFGPAFNLDYNFYKTSGNQGGPSGSANNAGPGPSGISNNGSSGLGPGSGPEYPNELYMPNDYSKNFANHMDIPSNGSNMVMLSTTSLLHGNCVFNRNNTVATQQGMKTYWLCKSYRISMCRARCITHLGRIISATGVHNHTPHMRGSQGAAAAAASASAASGGTPPVTVSLASLPNHNQPGGYSIADGSHIGADLNHVGAPASSRLGAAGNMFANQTPPPTAASHHHHHLGQPLPNLLVQHHPTATHMEPHGGMGSGAPPSNIMHNPNLMHLPMQPQAHHHHHQQQQQQQQQQHSPHTHHATGAPPAPTSQHHLELGGGQGVLLSPAHMQQSPQSNRSSHSMHAQESPLGMKSPPPPPVEEQQQQHQQQQQQRVDIGSSADGSAESAAPGTAHVINSITISPSSRHSFKMENM